MVSFRLHLSASADKLQYTTSPIQINIRREIDSSVGFDLVVYSIQIEHHIRRSIISAVTES
jgi:hypothetical protein